ncbi:transmembrane protein 53-A-like [Aplochiton taeniatus]
MSVKSGEEEIVSQRISKNITYYCIAGVSWCACPIHLYSFTLCHLMPQCFASCSPPPGQGPPISATSTLPPRPLLLLFPWLGARPAGVSKYLVLYLERGMDVLSVQSEVSHFLWPRWGLEYGLEVLKVLEDPRFAQRPLLVHACSIGGYTFTQLLTHMAKEPETYNSLLHRVKGHIYDSMVVGSLEHMATGLGKTLYPRLESFVRRAAMLFFWIFKAQTADYYSKGVEVFQNNPVTAPALFFFCENDVMCDPLALETHIDCWRTRGVSVESRKWKESVHAAHLRTHPEDYLSTLEKYLNSLTSVPLKARM